MKRAENELIAKNAVRIPAVLLALAFVLIGSQSLFAQGTRGTVRGTITDPNQAVLPSATVELVDVAKKITIRTTTTNESGEYQFVEIEPSTYNVIITANGFAPLTLNNVTVEPNRNVVLDGAVTLTGVTGNTVDVSAGAEQIDRETPTLGTTVENRRVQGLPLNGRNVLDLALLQPGVFSTGGTLGGLGIRVNGSRGIENNVTIDGASNNEVATGSTIGGITRPDAVQEFRLLTSNFEAEFGRNTGSIINIVTRSGTNKFHGNARFFYRGTELNAANFFENSATSGPADRRSPFNRKEYGFNIGGPVPLPHFGEGGPVIDKGKTFFFVDYERRYQKAAALPSVLSNLPTAAERNGDFSGLLAKGVLIYDPTTATLANPGGNPFPGNIIPANRINPISKYYNSLIPLGDANGRAVVANNAITRTQYITTRIDHNFNSSNTLNFTYNLSESNAVSGTAFGGTNIPGFGSADKSKRDNYVGRFTSVITPKLVNTFLFSYSKNDFPGVAPVNTTTPAQIGFTANVVPAPEFAGPPYLQFYERGFVIGNSIQGPQVRVAENIQFQDAVSYVAGPHRFKVGGDFVKYKQDQQFLFINNGVYTFSSVQEEGSNAIGDDFACFILNGCSPTEVQLGSNGQRDYRQTAMAAFVQDNWRVTNNLSLSLGLRYEYNAPLTDMKNRVAYYRRGAGITSPQLVAGTLSDNGNPIVAAGRPPVGLVYVGDPDPALGGLVPAGGVKKDKNNFAPRLGVAYSLNGGNGFFGRLLGENATVIRAGYGWYYGAIIGDTALQQLSAPGFGGTNAYRYHPGGTLQNPFGPDVFPLYRYLGGPEAIDPLENPFGQTTAIVVNTRLSQFSQPIDPFLETPLVQQYNVTFERSFLKDFVLGVSYVGNRGRKLYVQEQINPAVGTLIAASTRFQGSTTIPTATTANAASRRQNDDIPISLSQLTAKGKSRYDALEVNFQKRFSDDGLSFQLAYTRSRSLNDSDTQRAGIDILDQSAGYALSSDDRPNRFVGSFIYELPFFKNTSGFTKRLLDGWSIGGIYTYQSGDVFSVSNPYDTTGTGGGVVSFIDVNPNVAFSTADPRQGSVPRAFNADAFIAADCRTVTTTVAANGDITRTPVLNQNFNQCINADGTRGRRGTSRRNQFRLDNPTNNFDAILSKTTRLWNESSSLELRFEAFNAFNTTQFGAANLTFSTVRNNLTTSNTAFGTFTSAQRARIVQLGARLNF